ncbi:MAG TPA: hypothetical protein VEE84_03070 [Burkholderiaceae bacterium]|nr:hypothetical protein [Burkholderiaceae bacterium]
MSASSARRSRIAHSLGVLLGLSGLLVVMLLSSLLPGIDILWQVLLALFVLIFVRSLVGYLFPGFRRNPARRHQTPAVLR